MSAGAGAEVDGEGRSALHLAALNGEKEELALHKVRLRKPIKTTMTYTAPPAPTNAGGYAASQSTASGSASAQVASSSNPSPQSIQQHVMLSGRFNRDDIKDYMRIVRRRLEELQVTTFMVEAGGGGEFGSLTLMGLGRAKAMVAFCTEEYGALTGVGYETFRELEFAHQQNLPIIFLLFQFAIIDVLSGSMSASAGAEVDAKGRSALHLAAFNGEREEVERLVTSGAEIEATDKEGFTPLHLASEAGRLDVVDRLTEAKADLEAKGGPSRREPQRLGRLGRSEGLTPLHWAAEKGHPATVDRLVAAGAAVLRLSTMRPNTATPTRRSAWSTVAPTSTPRTNTAKRPGTLPKFVATTRGWRRFCVPCLGSA
eukprot:g12122.t1